MLSSSSQKRSSLTVSELDFGQRRCASLSPSPAPSRSSSARSLLEVREEVRWEGCSQERGRNVRARNVTERNRLTLVQSTLDRQLERELKRLAQERSCFNETLEQLRSSRRRGERLGCASSGSLPDLCLEPPKTKASSRRTSPSPTVSPLPPLVVRPAE